jgi:hypothetical protein
MPDCIECGQDYWIKKADIDKPAGSCPGCQVKAINATTTPVWPFTADDGTVWGQVLADCPLCGTVVEVQEGWVAPAHPTPQGTKVCAGTGRAPRRYEKVRFEVEARHYHKTHGTPKRSHHKKGQ